ncbi:hypothetical protein PDJAM_G00085550 [Pangasius djambal]|uniref:Uncharacterized protein n=1 Tax=Pangasius djambal TaxID=1691987 RepID=A0ACC5Z3Z7_9TELE|nr:hypothetical protein [Pangasius djambal]
MCILNPLECLQVSGVSTSATTLRAADIENESAPFDKSEWRIRQSECKGTSSSACCEVLLFWIWLRFVLWGNFLGRVLKSLILANHLL